MKFSFCSIAFRNHKITLQELIAFLAKSGYQGIELWANHVNGTDLRALRRCLETESLSVPMLSPYFDFTAGTEKWEQSIEIAEHFIKLASFLEVPLVRAFTGIIGSAEASEKQKEDCIRGLDRVCQIAQKRQVTIALETHPSTLVDNIESTLWLIEKVASPNLKVNLDIYHMFEVHKNPITVLEALFPYLEHVHAKNAYFRPEEREQAKHPLLHDPRPKANFAGVRPLASGEMDYIPFIEALARKNYQGYVSVEWFGRDPMTAAVSELAYLKSIRCESLQDQHLKLSPV